MALTDKQRNRLRLVLHTGLDRLVRESGRLYAQDPAPTRPIPTYVRQESGGHQMSAELRPDWRELVRRAMEAAREAKEISTASAALDKLLPGSLKQFAGLTFGGATPGESTFSGYCELALAASEDLGGMPDTDEADRRVEAFLGATTYTLIHRAPLSGVELDGGSLDIASDIKIVQLSDADRQHLWARIGVVPTTGFGLEMPPIQDIDNAAAELQVSVEIRPGDDPPWQALQGPVYPVVETLRLLGPGDIRPLAWWTEEPNHDPFLSRIMIFAGMGRPSRPPSSTRGQRLTLPSSDTAPAKLYALRTKPTDLTKQDQRIFDLALRRFNTTYERIQIDDKIIDTWIAFEALFLSDEMQELSYKARMRIAIFVTDDPDERIALADQLKDSYSVRSLIVHGSKESSFRKYQPLSDRADEAIELVRRSLRRWLEPGAPRTAEKLDALLLGKIDTEEKQADLS